MRGCFFVFILLAVFMMVRPVRADDGYRVACPGGQAPVISVVPATSPVQYDFSRSSAELSATQTDTVSPYAPGTKTLTEGIREDQPTIRIQVGDAVTSFPSTGVFCVGYDKIDIRIDLKPTIYIASEWPHGRCRDRIVEHEQKHIAVDHEVINDFAQKLGIAVQNAVNETGVIGPLNNAEQAQMEKELNNHIQSVVQSLQLPLVNEMRVKQAQVDSLQEYQAVSAICANGGQ